MSERHACGLLGIALSSCRYRSRTGEREHALRTRLVELAHENPRYGSPRLYVLLRREALCNHKRVERIYREAGLSLRRKKRKRLTRERVPMATVLAPNEEWALDFVADALASARSLRILTVVDAFTRECLALETDTSMGSLRVVRVLERLIAERGAPRRIRSDNGPEFTSRAYLAWSLERRIELVHIRPGKPIENALVESFNGRLREECLNMSWFRNLFDARRQIEAWRDHYNRVRPHSSLDYLFAWQRIHTSLFGSSGAGKEIR
jgi:putative transposase